MNKTFDKVAALGTQFFNFCCFGSATGSGYGYSRTATANMNLIEPFLDDSLQPICDSFHVEMFVFCVFKLALCQKPNSFKFAIDTFSWKCNQSEIGAANSTRFSPLFIIHRNKN